MSSCSRLEEIALKAREDLIIKNNYNDVNYYSSTHPNATVLGGSADDPNNNKGKGTGVFLDTSSGGSHVDVYGIPSLGLYGRSAIEENAYSDQKKYDCFI